MTVPEESSSPPLQGEDIGTEHWRDAQHWISIYDDLIGFKLEVLGRVEHALAQLVPIARTAAAEDVTIIRTQMEGYYQRLDLWHRRLWELQGLWIDPERRVIQHQGKEASLTVREFQLLQFLMNHPHRWYTADQIKAQAWGEPALFPEEVRNYIARIRRILVQMELPYGLLNRPRRGYSLVARLDT